jgi:hypothetical protein
VHLVQRNRGAAMNPFAKKPTSETLVLRPETLQEVQWLVRSGPQFYNNTHVIELAVHEMYCAVKGMNSVPVDLPLTPVYNPQNPAGLPPLPTPPPPLTKAYAWVCPDCKKGFHNTHTITDHYATCKKVEQ